MPSKGDNAVQLKDGLYIVNHGSINAAFAVRNGKVTMCAPVLRNKLDFFKRIAKWYPTNTDMAPVEQNSLDDSGKEE